MTDLSLLEDFIPETIEHLDELEAGLLALESNPADTKVLSRIFRSAHTIKGSAEYLGMRGIATIAHKLENLLDLMREGKKKPDSAILDALIESRDRIASLVADLQKHQEERTAYDDVIARLDGLNEQVDQDEANGPETDILGIGDGLEPLGDGEIVDDDEESARDEVPLEEAVEWSGLDEDPAPLADEPAAGGLVAEGGETDDIGKRALAVLSDEESYEEEYDDELFQIFTEHLFENLDRLKELSGRIQDGRDPEADFDVAIEVIASLKSSAAYMDYRHLSRFYDQFSEQAAEVKERVLAGKNVSVDFIADYVEQVTARISPDRAAKAAPGSAALKTVAGDPAPETENRAVETVEEEVLAQGAPEVTPAAAEPPMAGGAQGLFDELDSVFDASDQASGVEEASLDPFSGDLEDALASASKPGTPVKASKPEPKKEAAPEKSKPVKTEAGKAEKKEAPAKSAAKAEEKPAAKPAKPVQEKTAAPKKPAAPQEPQAASREDRQVDRMGKQTLRVDAGKIDTLMNQVGELVVSRASYAQLYADLRDFQQQLQRHGLQAQSLKQVRDLTFRLSEATVALGRVANDLQEGVMKVRMLPIAQLFNRYPRLVRDLVHNTGKQVNLEMKGEETELDKMVIEEIADPLVHIIRNAVDHGIETVEERKKKGKDPKGSVRLESYHESNHVVVEITDDGQGIDPDKVRAKALEKGLVTREELERMRTREVLSLIMVAGFSTSSEVTTTSGRGVGMDVVKKNVEKLNGTVEVDSKKGEGTRVRIKIPLTLAIIQALLVRVGGEVFTIPLSVVEETLRIQESEISTIEGVEVIQLREGVLSLLRLTDEFSASSSAPDPEQAYVVVVNTGMRQVGLVVDSLIGQEEAVIKPLVDYLQERSGFSGATILGDGSVSLILDVYELVNLSMQRQINKKHEPAYNWSPLRLGSGDGDEGPGDRGRLH